MVSLKNLILCLADNRVEFVIIGGVAATVHGSAYVTYDLDICYRRDAGNLARLAKALAPHHPKLRDAPDDLPFFWDETTLRRGLNFTLKTDLGDIDLLGEVAGLGGFEQVLASSVSVALFGVACAVLSLEALIEAKRAAGRPKDRLILPELEALREAHGGASSELHR